MTRSPFARGRFARPERVGDEVRRRPQQDNSAVHALLQHFEAVGFDLAPRFVGVDADGVERLSYLAGEGGWPPYGEELRSDAALVSVARAVRAMHDATQGFVPPDGAVWHLQELGRPTTLDCFGHHDLTPWNILLDGAEVTGLIDWDTAAPSNRVWDLSWAAYQFVPLHPVADLPAWGWDTVPDRRERLELFAAAYGQVDQADLVEAAIQRLRGMGDFIAQEVAGHNPRFHQHAVEGHAEGYLHAAAELAASQRALTARWS